MKKNISLFGVVLLSSLLIIVGIASAASCYPSSSDGSRAYAGTIQASDGSRMYLYVKAYANTDTMKNRADLMVYFWRGKFCTSSDEYTGRAGFSTYVDKNARTCISNLFFQFKKSANSWPTINIPGGWCGKLPDLGIYISVAVLPQLLSNGLTTFTGYVVSLFDKLKYILPWITYNLPKPVPTYV
jgi:hypothetical protein